MALSRCSTILHEGRSSYRTAVAIPTSFIDGTAIGETLNGTAGFDIIRALGGNDILEGGAGGDILDGGAGEDTVSYASAARGLRQTLPMLR